MDKDKLTPEEQFYIDEQMYFTVELNKISDKQIQEFHVEQKKNRDDILSEIAKVMLSYSVLNEIMNIKSQDKKKLETKLVNIVNEKIQYELNNETKLTCELLKSVGKDRYSANNYIYSLGTEDKKEPSNDNKSNKVNENHNNTSPKDNKITYKHNTSDANDTLTSVIEPANIKENTLDDIINRKVDEKLWSDRLWANKNQIAKDLKAEIRDFLDGKTTVNEIEERIKKKYNTNAHETKRLVQDNVARVQEGVNEQWREDNGIKYVLYMANLCSNTCANCRQYDGKPYEVGKKPVSLPQHCFCRCTYVNIPNPDWRPKMRLDNETKENINWQSYQEWKKNKNDAIISNKKWLESDFSTEKKFKKHIEKHLSEYGSTSEKEYLEVARKLLAAPTSDDIEGFVSKAGFVFKYRKSTNDFSIGRADGYISTLYKPVKGYEQWLEEINKYKKED